MSAPNYNWQLLRDRIGKENWAEVMRLTTADLGFAFDGEEVTEEEQAEIVGWPIFYAARHMRLPIETVRILAKETGTNG